MAARFDSTVESDLAATDLRKQAKGLRKVHLQDCLVDAIKRKQHKRAAAIKQKCNREESKRM